MDYTRLITWVASAALVVLALLGKAPSYVGMIGLAVSIVNNIVYIKVVLSPRNVVSNYEEFLKAINKDEEEEALS